MDKARMVVASAEDKVRACEDNYMITNTGFLDPAERSQVESAFRGMVVRDQNISGAASSGKPRIVFYGGYEEAERVVMVCLPDYIEDDSWKRVLSVVRCSVSSRASAGRSGRSLSHRDYLGALMGLGIRRDVAGDIHVYEDGADIVVLSEMAEYIAGELTSAGQASVSASVHDIGDLNVSEGEVVLIHDTVSSLRLDNVVASGFKMSRSAAAELIGSGMVFLNHIEATKVDGKVSEGDLISVRHKGRCRLVETGGRTRKDRINIVLERRI